jgi:ABC-type Fe3+-citrate transport system substrate-binding protein
MKASDAKKIEKMLEDNKEFEKKISSFEQLLSENKDLDPQKMRLWLEVYQNATSDRTIAHVLFTQAFSQLTASVTDHVTLGPTLVKYLERMCKSNDQLLSLADIVSKEVSRQRSLNSDDIFAQIEG